MTLFRINKNIKSNSKAQRVTAILHIQVLLITIKGTVALNKNTKT
jgi:hypothetical protein